MRLTNLSLSDSLEYPSVNVRTYNDTIRMTIDNIVYIDDEYRYITNFCTNLSSYTANSILLGGLGLGLICYYVEQNKTFTKFDVVEKKADVITAVNQLGYLSSNVNIIQGDFLEYTPSQSYDLIISDLHWGHPTYEPNFESEIETIKNRYTPYLNAGGTLYIPLTKYTYQSL